MDRDKEKNGFVNGDGNVVEGGIHNNQDQRSFSDSHNVTQVDSHNITYVLNGKLSEELSLNERKQEYRKFCAKVITDGIILKQTRIELDEYADHLGLDEYSKREIENKAKEQSKITDVLENSDRNILEFVEEQIRSNSNSLDTELSKLEVLVERTDNEKAHFYYYLVLAAIDPARYAKLYENRRCDSYWQTYWAFMAYKRCEVPKKADLALSDLNKYSEWKGNVSLLQSAGYLYNVCKDKRNMEHRKIACTLLQNYHAANPLLTPFYNTLCYLTEVTIADTSRMQSAEISFYLRLFDMKPNDRLVTSHVVSERTETFSPSSYTMDSVSYPVREKEHGKFNKYLIGIIGLVLLIAFWMAKGYFGESNEKNGEEIVQIVTEQVEEKTETEEKKTIKTTVPKEKKEVSKQETASTQTKQTPTKAPTKQEEISSQETALPQVEKIEKPAETRVTELSVDDLLNKGVASLRGFKDAKALAYFAQAAEKGSAQAYVYLGNLYNNGGNDVKKDFSKAFDCYTTAANAGIAEGQYQLGMMYRSGRGCTKDLAKAKIWFQKASSQGHAKAQRELENL